MRTRLGLLAAGLLVAPLLTAAHPATAAPPLCSGPVEGGCLPTPAECGTGAYNGTWTVRDAAGGLVGAATCIGHLTPDGQPHIVEYTGGSALRLCGAVVRGDVLVAGQWYDPNFCLRTPDRGPAMLGTRATATARFGSGAVASASQEAAQIGAKVLELGGNAVDAAVAATFAVGVADPRMCGIGGGGFLLLRTADGRVRSLDFREEAPAAFTPTTLKRGTLARGGTGHLVVGVPGTVAGLAEAVRAHGTQPLADLIAPAVGLARDGVVVSDFMADAYQRTDFNGLRHSERLRLFPATAAIHLRNGLLPWHAGATLKQEDYAKSLEAIAEEGPAAFYEGAIAQKIVDEMKESRISATGDAGVMTAEDLRSYRAVWRDALRGSYRGHEVVAAGPPTSGGLQVIEALNLLEGFDLAAAGHSSARTLHLLAEARKIAIADRDAHVADPDTTDVPTHQLTSKGYANSRRDEIDLQQAKVYEPGSFPGHGGRPAGEANPEGAHTTHVSAVDAEGNAVSVTCTIEQEFGSAVVAAGTGFLLNNQLTDFSAPGSINEAGPGKRPRSNTTPLIVVKDGVPVLVVGGAGGGTIPSSVLNAVVNTVDFGLPLAAALDVARSGPVAAGATGADGKPALPTLFVEEPRLPDGVAAELKRLKHPVTSFGEYRLSIVQAVGIDPATGERLAASDPRDEQGTAGH